MSGGSIQLRPDQVAELTRGHVLPVQAIPVLLLERIAEHVVNVWNDLTATHGRLGALSEVELNSLMCSRLNNLNDRTWRTLVLSVVAGHSVVSYNGAHLEKRPDLSLHLARRTSAFRLEVECKLMDHTNGKTVGLYAGDGLARFVDGEYGWGTREGLMLAYVRDGSSILGKLKPFLEKHQKSASDRYNSVTLPILRGTRTHLATSTHNRKFSYVHAHASAPPGAIVMWHIWLD